jgi:hypothetical protein
MIEPADRGRGCKPNDNLDELLKTTEPAVAVSLGAEVAKRVIYFLTCFHWFT